MELARDHPADLLSSVVLLVGYFCDRGSDVAKKACRATKRSSARKTKEREKGMLGERRENKGVLSGELSPIAVLRLD